MHRTANGEILACLAIVLGALAVIAGLLTLWTTPETGDAVFALLVGFGMIAVGYNQLT